MTMNTKYARFNLQLKVTEGLAEAMPEFQQYLHDAAIEGLAQDFEIFYYENEAITGVSVSYDAENSMMLLEAGSVLGYCLRRFEEYRGVVEVEHSWLSLHDSDERAEESVLPYPK